MKTKFRMMVGGGRGKDWGTGMEACRYAETIFQAEQWHYAIRHTVPCVPMPSLSPDDCDRSAPSPTEEPPTTPAPCSSRAELLQVAPLPKGPSTAFVKA